VDTTPKEAYRARNLVENWLETNHRSDPVAAEDDDRLEWLPQAAEDEGLSYAACVSALNQLRSEYINQLKVLAGKIALADAAIECAWPEVKAHAFSE
jgi:hypothetical protein